MDDIDISKIKSFGDLLRQKREDKGLSLEKLESLTNIKRINLENLENERFEKLPPKIYIKGIIAKYCKYVDLDENDILKRFDQYFVEHRDSEVVLRRNATFSVNDNKRRVFDINKIVIGILLSLFSVFLIFQLSLLILPPKITVIEPASEMSYTNSAIHILGKVSRTKILNINEQSVVFEKDGSFDYLLALEPGTNNIQISAKNQLGRKSTVIRSVVYQQLETIKAPTTTLTTTTTKSININN